MAPQSAMGLRVGVIGGGASGIIAAKCLLEEGHSVVVFERSGSVGGVWNYSDNADAHSVYKSLRTNFPTALMQLKDFPFRAGAPSYPSHHDVFEYLKSYEAHFHVDQVVRLHSCVTRVYKDEDTLTWKLCVSSEDKGDYEETVDRLVVCNGRFAKPFYASVKGLEHFHGIKRHSNTYRTPEEFANKSVLLIGRGPSGEEISAEIAEKVSARVTLSSRKYNPNNVAGSISDEKEPVGIDTIEYDGTLVLDDGSKLKPGLAALQMLVTMPVVVDKDDKRDFRSGVDHIAEDGSVVFTDGSSISSPDVILFCTGYVSRVQDFLPAELLYPKAVDVTESANTDLQLIKTMTDATEAGHAVSPVYKQVFSIADPTVAFIGLPRATAPFRTFDLQSAWAARVFNGTVSLPSKEAMHTEFLRTMSHNDLPLPIGIHLVGLYSYAYYKEISELAKIPLDKEGLQLFADAMLMLFKHPENFRSAEYTKDEATAKWVRHFMPSGSSINLVKTIE